MTKLAETLKQTITSPSLDGSPTSGPLTLTIKARRVIEPSKLVSTSYLETIEDVHAFLGRLRVEMEEAIHKGERFRSGRIEGTIMATGQVVVRGTLKPDGRLELDSSPNLPAGPVEVVLRSLSSPSQSREDWWQYLQRVRAELEAAAGPYRIEEEIEAERQDFRRGDDRVEEISRQIKGQGQNGMSTRQRDRSAFPPLVDRVCHEAGLDPRLTTPTHPWTHGQVDRMNRTRKDATVKTSDDVPPHHLHEPVHAFRRASNGAKRLQTRPGLTPEEHIWRCWPTAPARFTGNPHQHTLGLNSLDIFARVIKENLPFGRRLILLLHSRGVNRALACQLCSAQPTVCPNTRPSAYAPQATPKSTTAAGVLKRF